MNEEIENRYWVFRTIVKRDNFGKACVVIENYEICNVLKFDSQNETAIICNQFNMIESVDINKLMKVTKAESDSMDFVYIYAEKGQGHGAVPFVISDSLLDDITGANIY